MAYYMIAVINKNQQTWGYRIFNATPGEYQYIDVEEKLVKLALEQKRLVIENLVLENGELVGSNGSLDRYPRVSKAGFLVSKKSPLIVLTQIGDVGYRVVNFNGVVKKEPTAKVVEYAKEHGIANGKVVARDNIEFISSIIGTYPEEKVRVNKSKNDIYYNVKATAKAHGIELKNDRSTVARKAGNEVSSNIEEIDVFKSLSPNQKKVVENYYMWYTVDKYQELAKHVNLGITIGKAARLSEIRGVNNWNFGGVVDLYLKGKFNEHCELGHPIRYAYIAKPDDGLDNPDSWITFGSDCAAEFFHIKPEDMRNLVKTREIMSREIKLISEIVDNGLENLYMQKTPLIYQIIGKLGTNEAITAAFGTKLGYTILCFMAVKIPLPASLLIECTKYISKNLRTFFVTVFPEYSDIIDAMLEQRKQVKLINGAYDYLHFMGTSKLEGVYEYNPLDENSYRRRDKGAYNKDARLERERLLMRIERSVLCSEFTFEEINKLFETIVMLSQLEELIREKLTSAQLNSYYNLKLLSKLEGYVESVKSTAEQRIKSAILNALIFNESIGTIYAYYGYYGGEKRYYGKQVYKKIQEFHADMLKAKEYGFNKLADEVLSYVTAIDNEIKEQERLREEARIAAEKRREEARRAEERRREELRRQREEELRKEEEKRRLEEEERLRKQEEDRQIEEANKLSKLKEDAETKKASRQKKHSDTTDSGNQAAKKDRVKKSDTEPKETKAKFENTKYELEDRKDIDLKIAELINKENSEDMKGVLEVVPNAIKIAYTIKKNKTVSERQIYSIEKAYNKLKEIEAAHA